MRPLPHKFVYVRLCSEGKIKAYFFDEHLCEHNETWIKQLINDKCFH